MAFSPCECGANLSAESLNMYPKACALSGALDLARLASILPRPNADVLRQLRRFIDAAGLSYDLAIGLRDPRLAHCIHLPGPALLVTATRASAPLLQANCVRLAQITGLDMLLMRFCSPVSADCAAEGASVCLVRHDPPGRIVSQEGYRATIRSEGGLLLRHASPGADDYEIRTISMVPVAQNALR